MARYTFLCDEDDSGCGHTFEIACSISEYEEKIDRPQTCPECRKIKSVRRDLQSDAIMYVGDSTPKTLGAKCDKNSSRISADEKHHLNKKHNAYKEVAPSKPLPKGMSRTR